MNGRTATALPESSLSSVDRRQRADAAGRDHVVGDARGREVVVARERRAARRRRPEQDLIGLQRRRLEHDRGAVRQRPLGDAGAVDVGGLDDAAARRRRIHQRLARRRRRRRRRALLADAVATTAASCDSVGSTAPAASGADTTTSRFCSGNQSAASAFISASVISGRKRRWNASSCQIVGSASRWRKLRVYSSARLDDSRSGLSCGHALGAGHVRLLRAIELGGGEAEARDALQFGHERVEAARDAVVRDQRLHDRFVARPRRREQARGRRRRCRNGGFALLAELVEPVAEHLRRTADRA